MMESLDLLGSREQVCPLCNDHGWYRRAGSHDAIPCERGCAAGRAVVAVEQARRRLSQIYSSREVELWLHSRTALLGGAVPLDLLREGREDEVLEVIERLPGLPPLAEVPEPASEAPIVAPLKIKERPDLAAVRGVMINMLKQAGEVEIATALEQGTLETLGSRERALFDALLTGQGYLVNGKRVDPVTVEVVRWRV